MCGTTSVTSASAARARSMSDSAIVATRADASCVNRAEAGALDIGLTSMFSAALGTSSGGRCSRRAQVSSTIRRHAAS